MIAFLLIFVFVNITASSKEVAVISDYSNKTLENYDIILCRGCGIDLSSSQDIVSKPSLASRQSIHDTLFNTENVLVQVLLSDLFFYFPVITTKHSTCVGVGEWEESESWYPDYYWKPCVCSECGAYVGWVFKPIEPNIVLDLTTIFPSV